jgi:hypothetical protein
MAELRVKGTGTIKLFENDNTSSVTIASPASLGADRTITLPDASVTLASGTMLATDGSGASLTALNASELGSGTVPTARLGTGTASSSTFLAGDNTWGAAGGGKILQAVTATDSTSVNTTSTSFVTASNTLTVDITPAAITSKIWIVVSATGGHAVTNGSVGFFTVFRDSTDLGAASDKGLGENYGGSSDLRTFIGFSILDSPSTTSAITYQVYFRNDGSSGNVDLNWNGTKGTITVFELGA